MGVWNSLIMNDSKEMGGQLRQQIWVGETRPPSAAPAVLKGSLNGLCRRLDYGSKGT